MLCSRRAACFLAAWATWLLVPSPASGQAQIATTVLAPPAGRTGDGFGRGVAISGNTLVVGAHGDDERGTDAGTAYVYVHDTSGEWLLLQKLHSSSPRPGEFFGWSVDIDGDVAVVGTPGDRRVVSESAFTGATYVFARVTSRSTHSRRPVGTRSGWTSRKSTRDPGSTRSPISRGSP